MTVPPDHIYPLLLGVTRIQTGDSEVDMAYFFDEARRTIYSVSRTQCPKLLQAEYAFRICVPNMRPCYNLLLLPL